MTISQYTIEVQADEADFSDSKTMFISDDIAKAVDVFIDADGHRRLIGWLDLGVMRSPVELIRV
jgi:hypothetical protein